MKKIKNVLALVMTIAMALPCISCSNNDESSIPEGYTHLRLFINNGGDYEGAKKDRVWEAIQDETKTIISIEGAGGADYSLTLAPMINTGDVPDITFCMPGASAEGAAYDAWADPQDGVFWNYDDLFSMYPGEFPYLENIISSSTFKNITFYDQHPFLPHQSGVGGWAIYYRSDWLVNVGEVNVDGSAKVPITLEDFQRVLKKFTTEDPDGNGIADTYGLAPQKEPHTIAPLYHAFGVHPDWNIDQNGDVQFMYTDNKFKNFLAWINDMYSKGYIDPQFNVNTEALAREKFINGKCGIMIDSAGQHMTWILGPFEKKNGKAEEHIVFGPAPEGTSILGEDGAKGWSKWGGYWGGYSISKYCKNPHAALKLLNFLYSSKGTELRLYGIKGVHFDYDENGEVVYNELERLKEPTNRFMIVSDENGTPHPSGYYQMGVNMGGVAVEWKDYQSGSEIKWEKPKYYISDLNYNDLMEQAEGLIQFTSSNLTNFMAFPMSIKTAYNKTIDYSKTFVNNAILGKKNLGSDWNKMIADCDKAGFSQVKNILKQCALEKGVY